jgi:hypothetical protein
MLSPPETDTGPGATRGTCGELGNRLNAWVCGTGGTVRRDTARAGQPARDGPAGPGEAPPSHTWRGLVAILPDAVILPDPGHAYTVRHARIAGYAPDVGALSQATSDRSRRAAAAQ